MRFLYCFVLGAFAATAALAETAHHPPRTAAEIALDKVLGIANADDRILDNLFQRYPDSPVPADKQVDYRGLLTPRLLNVLADKERGLVKSACGGKYREGEVCGIDYNPITCAQDIVDGFAYYTIKDDGNRAAIATQDNTYVMARDGGGWKLDEVDCEK